MTDSTRGDQRHIQDLIAARLSRRGLLGGLAALPLLSIRSAGAAPEKSASGFAPVAATQADAVTVPAGYRAQPLIAWGDALFDSVSAEFDPDTLTRAEQEHRFGQSNDMIALFPARYSYPQQRDQDRLLMCVNHESADASLMFPALADPDALTPSQIEAMYASVGVSVVQLERSGAGWRFVRDAKPGAGLNRRITPFSTVLFEGPAATHPWIETAAGIVNAHEAGEGGVRCGTMSNCAGGVTPWGTYLTSEENFDGPFFNSDPKAPVLAPHLKDGAYILDVASFAYPAADKRKRPGAPAQFDLAQNPTGPALYGWIVEIDPHDPSWIPRKRTAIGRKKGEAATTALARDGRVVVYSGDDQIDEYVYKFVSAGKFNPADRLANRDLLNEGRLHVARFEEDGSGAWLALTLEAANAAAKEAEYPHPFRDEADLMVRAREASRLIGATPMDRPEDVEAMLDDGHVGVGTLLLVCTNNKQQGFSRPGNPRRDSAHPHRAQSNLTGHIVRIEEAHADCGALSFSWDIFALAGDPGATALTAETPSGTDAFISCTLDGRPTITGDRFACPDNICFDRAGNVWISTDGSDAVFGDCNDSVLVAVANGQGPCAVKRFLVGPVGAEICGPVLALDERAFFCAIQHPGEHDRTGADYSDRRWNKGAKPPSSFPDRNGAWPRSAVVIVTRDDGGLIGA